MNKMVLAGLGLVVVAGVFAACAPAAGTAGKSATLTAVGNLSSGAASSVVGNASVAVDSPKSKVTVTLHGLEPNSKHAGHLHIGTCAAVGPVAVGLNVITADANGNGSSITEIETAKLAGGVYVAYHQRGPDDANGIGSFITCGAVN